MVPVALFSMTAGNAGSCWWQWLEDLGFLMPICLQRRPYLVWSKKRPKIKITLNQHFGIRCVLNLLFCSFLNHVHFPFGLKGTWIAWNRGADEGGEYRACCWNISTCKAEQKVQQCLFWLLQVLQVVSKGHANPLLVCVSEQWQAMSSKSPIFKKSLYSCT